MPCTGGGCAAAHKDYLAVLMGLELRREALGDIVLPEDQPGTAYVFALEPAAQLICRELFQAGHTELTTELLTLDEVPQFPQAEREMHSATVSSLRLDAVLADNYGIIQGHSLYCMYIFLGKYYESEKKEVGLFLEELKEHNPERKLCWLPREKQQAALVCFLW
mgnify:CR=1 FL=1